VYNVVTAQFEDNLVSPYPVRTTTNTGLGLIDPTGGAYAPGIIIATPCPADFNGDGFVDDADFVEFASTYEAFVCP
jgi:hypothetical protein